MGMEGAVGGWPSATDQGPRYCSTIRFIAAVSKSPACRCWYAQTCYSGRGHDWHALRHRYRELIAGLTASYPMGLGMRGAHDLTCHTEDRCVRAFPPRKVVPQICLL